MANKYKNYPQTVKEDLSDQRLAAVRRQQQESKKRFSPRPGYHSPKTYYDSNIQKIVLKSTLNPNAKEFYPSYMEPRKNGYTQQSSINNAMTTLGANYEFGVLYEYDQMNRYLASGRHMRGIVQRSNTVLPLMGDSYSGSGSTNFDSQSNSVEDSISIVNTNKNTHSSNAAVDTDPVFVESENLKSGENVWFVNKGIETNQVNSNSELWTSKEDTEETVSKEEFFDAEVSWNDGLKSRKSEKDDESKAKEKNKLPNNDCYEGSNNARKKLIMLYPSKKQHENIIDSSQESIFGEPNAISYTSDESFLQCYNDDVNRIDDLEGKELVYDVGKPSNEEIFDDQDSEDFERTAKQSDSKSDIILDRGTSDCELEEQQPEQYLPTKSKPNAKQVELVVLKKPDPEKSRRISLSKISDKDIAAQKFQSIRKDVKAKKISINCTISRVEPAKLLRSSLTAPKIYSSSNTVKTSETAVKTIPKISTTGAIPKTKESILKTVRRVPLAAADSTPKVTRAVAFKPNTSKKEEKDTESRNQRFPNGFVASRTPAGANTRRIDAGSINTTHHTEVKFLVRPETSTKKTYASGSKTSDGNSFHPKTVTLSPSTYINTLNKCNVLTYTGKEKTILQKSVIKTQMRSPSSTVHQTTRKVLVINNVPKNKNIDPKKAKTKTAPPSRSPILKTDKATTSTKIPVRQKTTSLKGVNAVIGSDGDNIKIQTSRSCTSLRRPHQKDSLKVDSNTSIKIGDKLSESKQKILTSETSNLTVRHTFMKNVPLV